MPRQEEENLLVEIKAIYTESQRRAAHAFIANWASAASTVVRNG